MAQMLSIRTLSALIIIFIFTSGITGCSSPGKRTSYRASDAMLGSNPIKKIALVGEAKVMRPRMGGKDAILSLSSSKLMLEDAIPKLKTAFEKKGYEVVYAEPAGVGFYWRGPDDYWVYDYEAKEGQSDKWRVTSMDPVFVYPEIKNNEPIKTAVTEEFERLNDHVNLNRLLSYFPKNSNVSTIAQHAGADTVCFTRLWGKRYSAGRVIGDLALRAVAAMFGVISTGGLQEIRYVNVVCANTTTQQLVWQHTHLSYEDPIGAIKLDPESNEQTEQSSPMDIENIGKTTFTDTFFDQAIANLPQINQNYAANCKMTNKANLIVSCSDSSSNRTAVSQY